MSTQGNASEVFSNTLIELAFILFFLLLLIFVVRMSSMANDSEEQTIEVERLEGQVGALMEERDSLHGELLISIGLAQLIEEVDPGSTQDFTRLIREAAHNRGVELENQTLRSALRENQDALTEERKALARYRAEHPEIVERAHLTDSLRERIRIEMESRDQAQREAARYKSVAQRLGGESALGRGGIDFPPCWQNQELGTIEYLMTINLHEDGFVAVPIWPEYRNEEANQIPVRREFMQRKLSFEEFGALAQPILDWSKRRDCRHFVRVIDRTDTKEGFKRSLLTVENFFYKYLNRD